MQKAWIDKMMERGLCTCDDEHMFDCPRDSDDLGDVKSPSAVAAEQQAFDDVLDRILGEKVLHAPSSLSVCLSVLQRNYLILLLIVIIIELTVCNIYRVACVA